MRDSQCCILGLLFQEGFYSAQEGVNIVLSWHLDFYCHDGSIVDGRVIITI